MPGKTKSGAHFDWIAPVYDALVFMVFDQRLKRAQAVFLDRIPLGASVLVVGGGTGWLLEPLLTQGRAARIVYLEPSPKMLARASRRMLKQRFPGRVEFRLGDERSLRSGERYDVLLTPFVLDLFTTETLQTRLIPRLRSALTDNGLWLITDFVLTRVWWQRALVWAMIRFFILTARIEARHLANWQRLLSDAGLLHRESSPQVGGLVSTEVWTV